MSRDDGLAWMREEQRESRDRPLTEHNGVALSTEPPDDAHRPPWARHPEPPRETR